ncbi:carbohydrate ABC transporter permease [Fictibacillus phosphorivorans]|uniref:carbohydrate ABC transporter permease n=1 Tax=Fictibacillus phosphorivorans TaxID=1221500 RepID=UPI00203C64F4|nr:sugar ABC transporter permease [Fictibacillus phosphorivorans]MCM3717718.1 sugar ABC transporter permease [Fictibacillus phosphorivorans]MCM3775618.1 sugar ABC transporter permease [Fictibacillus phosphorivorans]
MNNYPVALQSKEKKVVQVAKKRKKFNREAWIALLFVAPTFLGLFVFYMMPAVASFGLAFTSWDGLTAPIFVGFENITNLIQDQSFHRSIINTVVFTLVSVPLSVCIATLISVLLNQKIKGMTFYRTLYFLPVVTMPVAVGMVWKWLYNTEYGLINYILGIFHLP